MSTPIIKINDKLFHIAPETLDELIEMNGKDKFHELRLKYLFSESINEGIPIRTYKLI